MKTRIAIPVLIITLFACCKEDRNPLFDETLKCPVNAARGEANQILGRWKLVSVLTLSALNDYSCSNIFYDFRENGVLIVTGGVTAPQIAANGIHNFMLNEVAPDHSTRYFELYINEKNSAGCEISASEMILNQNNALDGPIIKLIRIE